jgi:hypothetical protein
MSKIIGEEHEGISDNSFITREREKPGYINICAGDKTSYQWAELKSSALVYFLNKNDDTHNQLVGYLQEIIHKVLSYLNKNIDIELQKYQEKIKTTEQKDPYYVDTYPVAQVKAYTSSDLNIIKENFYMMYNFLTYIWKSMIFDLPEHIQDCTDEHLTTYFIVQLLQQGIMMDIIIARGPKKMKI